MLKLKELTITGNKEIRSLIPLGEVLINTYSFNTALIEPLFAEVLQNDLSVKRRQVCIRIQQ